MRNVISAIFNCKYTYLPTVTYFRYNAILNLDLKKKKKMCDAGLLINPLICFELYVLAVLYKSHLQDLQVCHKSTEQATAEI